MLVVNHLVLRAVLLISLSPTSCVVNHLVLRAVLLIT